MSEPADEPDGPSVDLPEPEEVFDLSGGLLDVPTDATQEVKLDWETDAPSVPGPGPSGVPLHEVQPVSPFGAPLPANAPLGAEDKASGRFADAVSPPPITAAAPTGPRTPTAGQHNWVPRGPRNLGGRVSALAISPADPRTMYAGAASGGVFKTIDGGESWFPLPFWHDAPSLSIGAIGICHDHPLTVYVATGEVKTGGNEAIPGNGVYRSDDGGLNWGNAAVPPVPGAAPNQAFVFEAVAVHPSQTLHCWAVGPAGVFRTLDGGTNWTQFEAGVYYSDVAFSVNAAGNPIVYLVCADAAGAFAVRLDDPAGASQAAISAAANRSRIVAAPAPAPPAVGVLQQAPDVLVRLKIAICTARPDIAFVRIATRAGGDFGVFRTRTARNAPMSGAAWVRLTSHLDWRNERQGTYNLSIAVDPGSPNNVATGMVDLYLSRNANAAAANVRWLRAMAWEMKAFDHAHHEDHHAASFAAQPGAAAGTPPALWVANDGGISASTDWSTAAGYEGARRRPLGVGVPPIVRADLTLPLQGVDGNGLPIPGRPISWRKRSHGITAGQMYDVTQSPLVPTLYGCGFQDNGVWVTSGSETWRFVFGADGGFLAFDPDDAYRFLATWQEGIADVEFPGRLLGYFPVPGDPMLKGVWPRALNEGFPALDDAAFVADTAHHPRKSGRVLHTRLNRLYGMPASGERWQAEQVGPGIELIYQGTATQPQIEVLQSAGAQHLGLVPQLNPVTVRSYLLEPFGLVAGDQLNLLVDGNPINVIFNPGGAIPNLAAATAAQVAAYIRANVPVAQPTVTPQPYFPPTGLTVELATRGVGAAQQISIGGSALVPAAPGGLPPLGLLQGAYTGSAGSPAVVMLGFPGRTREDFVRNRNLTGLELTVQVGAGPVRHIPFVPPAFPDPALVRTGELRAAIAAACVNDPVDVVSRAVFKLVRISDLGGLGVTVTGTATGPLNITPGGAFTFVNAQLIPQRDQFFNQNVGNFGSFDLTPPVAGPFQLSISDNIAPPAPPLVFNAAAGAANLRCVTAEELQRILTAYVNAIPAANQPLVQFDVVIDPDPGKPRSIRYAESDPDVVWVGGEDGFVYASANDGGSWRQVTDARFRMRDRSVEALAIDPRDHRTVYLGLAGRTHAVPGDFGFLWKTTDDGVTWNPIGAEVVDSAGVLVGVNALEIDPAAPDTVFAATDVGVFRSTDAGAHWAPFNEGLPNVFVRDLAFSAPTRTLRAGAWGRGVYERHVGDLPARDVRLYARASSLDDGSVRPAPDGPDLFATTPTAAGAASPDIKVARDRPPGIGIDDLVDGVEFDEDIVHEGPVAGAGHVFVQVHNRGAFPASEVRLVALWADATNGPPPLPADFWAKYQAAGPIAAALAPWTLVGDTRSGAALAVPPGSPRTQTFDVVWPPEIEGIRRIGILLLASGKEDALAAAALDVPTLVATEAKVAYRETAVVRAAEDGALFLKQTGPVQFTVANPAAGTAAPVNLGIAAAALGGAVSELAGGAEPFNLAPAPQALTVSTPPQSVTIPFAAGADIVVLGNAQTWEVMAVMNRELQVAGIPARVEIAPVLLPPPPPPPPADNFNWRLVLRGSGGATVAVSPPPGGVNDASPIFGWAAGPAVARLVGNPGPYILPAGSAVQITATNIATLQLDVDDFGGHPERATARDVRRALNRGFAAAKLPVQAIVPTVDLRIRRSTTDVDGAPASVAGRRMADLAVSHDAVADAGRPALFGLLEMMKQPLVQANHDSFIYVRVANLGTVAEAAVRHRVYQLAMGASPIAAAAIGAAVPAAVPAGGSAIVELPWNPGAAAAGDRLFVLAVADVDADGRRLDPPPAGFATVEELDAFCDAHPNAAYREFAVFV